MLIPAENSFFNLYENNGTKRYNRVYRNIHFIDCLLFKFKQQNQKRQFDVFANELYWSRISLFSVDANEVFAI